MFDTHCHVYKSEMENYEDIIKESDKSNIKLIINGTDRKSNEEILKLSKIFNNVYASIGYAQDVASDINEDDFSILEEQIKNNKIVAIGEIGIDYYWTKENKDKQIYVFKKQLELAEKYNLPVIVHARDAIQDVYDIIKKSNVRKGSMHCYSGSYEMAKEFIKLGFKIGIDGPITFKNNKKQVELVEKLNLNDLLVETDSPYLSPEPNRGKQNTPLNLIYIINKIAEIKNETPEKVIKILNENTINLYNLGEINE